MTGANSYQELEEKVRNNRRKILPRARGKGQE
jgi:hypothetical protein